VLHLVWFAEFGRKVGSPRGGAHVGEGAFLMGVYQAPEAGDAKRPTQKGDVYSFGVVLLELLTGSWTSCRGCGWVFRGSERSLRYSIRTC
jgi:hypothetical protein